MAEHQLQWASTSPKPKHRKIYAFCALLTLVTIIRIAYTPFFLSDSTPTNPHGFDAIRRSACFTMASVRVDGQWGLINVTTGEEIIPIIYDYSLGISSDGMTTVWLNGMTGVIDTTTGNYIIPLGVFDTICLRGDGIAYVRLDGISGAIDIATGNEIIPFGAFNHIWQIRDGMAHVSLDGMDGVIDIATGNEIIPFGRYYSSFQFWGDSLINARRHLHHGAGECVINIESGETIIPLNSNYNWMTYSYGMVWVTRGGGRGGLMFPGERGVIELATGDIVIPFGRYEYIEILSSSMARVRLGDTWGIIDLVSGSEVIPFGRYAVIRDYISGMVIARDLNGCWSVIDIENENKIMLFSAFEDIMLFSDGIVAVLWENLLWNFELIDNLG